MSAYGFCPKCGGRGVRRERRPNGNDQCVNGHTYPSRDAITVSNGGAGEMKHTVTVMHREPHPSDANALMDYHWETRHMSIFARVPAKPLDNIVYITKAPTPEMAEWIASCHNQRLDRSRAEVRRG